MMMKQPELGRKIAELRNARGWTQEELVEKCNVSVRTIQRIEAGEVTPRSYTVKTILSALDYDYDIVSIQEDSTGKSLPTWLGTLLLMHAGEEKTSDFSIRQLQIAWAFGIVYFILSFVEAPAEYVRFEEGDLLYGAPAYMLLKIILLVSFVFFQRGFIVMSRLFNNYLLRIMTVILISATVLLTGYDIVSTFYDAAEREFVLAGASVLHGVIGVLYGIALGRLESSVGTVAKLAAAFEVIAGGLFITVVLSLIGDLVHVPAELFGIIILFKALEQLKATKANYNFA